LTERAVVAVVREYATQIGIGELAPMIFGARRRSSAREGRELEQIQFLLGHEYL